MSTLKRAAIAAACTAGLTLGAFASASPAFAVAGAVYDCYLPPGGPPQPGGPPSFDDVEVEFDRDTGGNLVINTEIDVAADTIPAGDVDVVLYGSGTTLTNPAPVTLPFVSVSGASGPLASAPGRIEITVPAQPGPGTVTVQCYLVSSSGTWPV